MRNRNLMCVFSVMCSTLLLVQPCYAGFWSDFGSGIKKIFSSNKKEVELAHYILPEKKITQQEHMNFLKHLTNDQRVGLLKNLDSEANGDVSAEVLAKNFHNASNHIVTQGIKKMDYHKEVKWLAKKIGIHAIYLNMATTFQLENLICQRLFISMWDRLSEEQRKQVLLESGMDSTQASGIVSMSGAAVLAGMGTMAAMGGFAFYILMAKTVVVIAAVLGIPAATTITAISVMCGPIGWGVAAVAAVAGAAMVWGGADVQKMAGFIVQTHMYKVNAMQSAGINPDKYIWLDDPDLYK